jgi:class 3 adenylate cyclase
VWEDGRRLSLPGGQPRAVLALLLLNANEVVSADRVIDEIWGERPPDTARHALHGYVSRLRKALGPDALMTQPGGYAAAVAPDGLDVNRFTAQVEEGRRVSAADPERGAELLHDALALWRGPALADFTFEPFAQADIVRLEELRLVAQEERIDADLALGRHAGLAAELEALVERHPLRERFRAQLMLALYRSGRQAEALETYHEGRRALVEQLGIDPTPALQRLEKAILTQDESLELPAVTTRPSAEPLPETSPVAQPPSRTDAPPELRKTVTVLFTDLVRSSELWEELDPEVLRRVLARYFEMAAAVGARHGGTLEKFIGDAVVAVFGIPTLHEDDALRAVRAAAELREALARLNEELEMVWGIRLTVRSGLNTGEVIAVAAPPEGPLASGDVLNQAARLQQVAAPDEILIGEATWHLVREAARVEDVGDVDLRGRSRPTRAFRLFEVLSDELQVDRQGGIGFVGRELELAQLRQAFERAATERRPYLFTLLGTAGVGKSRLVQEFLGGLDGGVRQLTGRCLPYGEGITFWPIAEIVRAALGDQPKLAIAELLPADEAPLVAGRVEAVVGQSDAPGSAPETFWAIRRLLEELAQRSPLVVVLEDIHWAEETLLDLVEHLADWTHDAALFLLCLARPDLFDQRPAWGGGKLNAASILLQPLDDADADRLIDSLLGGVSLPPTTRATLREAAGGNPLFLDQMLALLADRDAGPALEIPPTIQALLAARLERLGPGERGVVDAAAVVGKDFWRGAVEDLLPVEARESVGTHLLTLTRKQILRPSTSAFEDESGFRFEHILIQDAAYRAISKERRAHLHERFAAWLERTAGPRVGEYEEILAFHLEQTYLYRRDLGLMDDQTRAAAERAFALLAASGRRAFARDDMPSAANLLERATGLRPDHVGELASELSEALSAIGELGRADDVLERAIDLATAAGDARLEMHARLEMLLLRAGTDPDFETTQLLETAEAAIVTFERMEDDLGLAKAWRAIAEVHLTACHWGLSAEAMEHTLQHAERCGDERERTTAVAHLAAALYFGPTAASTAILRCEHMLSEYSDRPRVEANLLYYLGGLRAMEGDFQQAFDLVARGREIFERLGHRRGVAYQTLVSGPLKLLSGDAAGAEAELREAWAMLEAMGETGILSSITACLAEAVCALGRYDEAIELTMISESASAEDDVAAQSEWRSARAKALTRLASEPAAARTLAGEAVARADETDFLNLRADARAALAEVLALCGNGDEAAVLFEEAHSLYLAKGNGTAARLLDDAITPARAGATR